MLSVIYFFICDDGVFVETATLNLSTDKKKKKKSITDLTGNLDGLIELHPLFNDSHYTPSDYWEGAALKNLMIGTSDQCSSFADREITHISKRS